jgi:hypothetical protein
LVKVDGHLRVGQLKELAVRSPDGFTFDRVHLLDTVNLGAENLNPKRWEQSWFPVYSDPATGGLAVKKPQDAGDWDPVIVDVDHDDKVDVSFDLNPNNRLKYAQQRVVESWKYIMGNPDPLPCQNEFFEDEADEVA